MVFEFRVYAQMRQESETEESVATSIDNQISTYNLLGQPRFFFGLVAQMNMLMAMQYYAPLLALQLNKYGYTGQTIALIYGIPAIIYSFSCSILNDVVHIWPFRSFISIGYFMLAISAYLIGGA